MALTMAVCGAQHVLTGAMFQSMGYQTMYLQVRLGARARRVAFLNAGMLSRKPACALCCSTETQCDLIYVT